jgi:hypothetical protein
MKNVSINIFRISGRPVLETQRHEEVDMGSIYLFDSTEGHRGNGIAVSFPIERADRVQRAVAAFERVMTEAGADSEGMVGVQKREG